MIFARPHRPWIAWLAACVVLLGALAPAVTQGLRGWAKSPITWVEVCSAKGAKLVALADASTGKTAKGDGQNDMPLGGDHSGKHCPFCLPHIGDVAVLPPAPSVLALGVPGRAALPHLFLRGPGTLFAWAPSQARAPPAAV
ncbi:MAG: DUF2946 domain-containing protein [Rubrivivax sp.]|nr:MAG: DUF2946 domain-containing protein [Rubrivivax sp.]